MMMEKRPQVHMALSGSHWSEPRSSLSSVIPERSIAPTEPEVTTLAFPAGSVAFCPWSQTRHLLLSNKNSSRLSKRRLYPKGLLQKGEGLLQEKGLLQQEDFLTVSLQASQGFRKKKKKRAQQEFFFYRQE